MIELYKTVKRVDYDLNNNQCSIYLDDNTQILVDDLKSVQITCKGNKISVAGTGQVMANIYGQILDKIDQRVNDNLDAINSLAENNRILTNHKTMVELHYQNAASYIFSDEDEDDDPECPF